MSRSSFHPSRMGSHGNLARQSLSPRCDLRRRRHQLRPVLRGRPARRAVPRRRPGSRAARRDDGDRRVRLARVPAAGRSRAALRVPGARARTTPRPASGATRRSCCSTPTRRRSRARSTGTSRCSPTGSTTRTPSTTPTASATRCSSVVVNPYFDWGNDRPPRREYHETVIYEAHVKGLTMTHPGVPEEIRGTYAALAHPSDHPAPHRPRRHRDRADAGAPVRAGHDPAGQGPVELLGLQHDRLLRPAQRLRLRAASAASRCRSSRRHGQGAARGGHRGDPRRGLQPHRRGQPHGPDAVLPRHRQRRLLPARRRRRRALLRHHGHRQQPAHAAPARAAADHGLAAVLGDRDARRRLPVRPRRDAGPAVPRGRPAVARSSTSSSRTR